MFSITFIKRPILAMVISLLIIVGGLTSMVVLPIIQVRMLMQLKTLLPDLWKTRSTVFRVLYIPNQQVPLQVNPKLLSILSRDMTLISLR
jgi:hypothetical protein